MQREFYLFHVGPVPVSASIWYFLLLAFMVSGGDMMLGAVWAVVVTVSILIHELGHAAMAQRFRLHPRIVLHGLGGLCAHDRAEDDRSDALIIAAGPGAGLLLGVLSGMAWVALEALAPALMESRPIVRQIFGMLLFVNIFWSLVNLLPLFPLDGGQLFRLGMLRVIRAPARAEKITHGVGIAIGVLCVAAAAWAGMMFAAVLALMLVAANVQAFRAPSASGAIRSRHTHAHELLNEAEAALAAGQGAEAARLGHQVRALPTLPDALADRAMELIALGCLVAGKVDEGLRYAAYPVPTARLAAACVETLLKIGDREEAAKWIALPIYQRIPAQVRARIEGTQG